MARAVALLLDPLLGVLFSAVVYVMFVAVSPETASTMAVIVAFGYLLWYLWLLRTGRTPGRQLMRLQVLAQDSGEVPGFGTMLLRDVTGRVFSAMVGGLGYVWALIDQDAQTWHDKLARTVVVRCP